MTRKSILSICVVLFIVVLALSAFAPAPDQITIDANTLAGFAGVILSLAFGYVPGIESWYGTLDGKAKAGIMAILLIITAVAIFAGGCVQLVTTNVACTQQGVITLIQIVVTALVANQSTFTLAVRPFKS